MLPHPDICSVGLKTGCCWCSRWVSVSVSSYDWDPSPISYSYQVFFIYTKCSLAPATVASGHKDAALAWYVLGRGGEVFQHKHLLQWLVVIRTQHTIFISDMTDWVKAQAWHHGMRCKQLYSRLYSCFNTCYCAKVVNPNLLWPTSIYQVGVASTMLITTGHSRSQ